MKYIVLFLFSILGNSLLAQVPAPAPKQSQPIAITGATIHVGDGTVIENGVITFQNGKIVAVGKSGEVSVDIDKFKLVEVDGKHIYPGLILPSTNVGLVEVEAVSASVDDGERGQFNPNVRSIVAYNAESELIPTLRFNGVLLAQIAPNGGMVSGTSSIVQLDAWNWQDAAYKMDDGIHMYFPSESYGPRWWRGETERRPNKDYHKQVGQIESSFSDAKAFSKSKDAKVNIKLEGMKGLFDGSKTLFIHASDAKKIVASILTAKKADVKKIVIVGGAGSYLITDFLKENKIAVILTDVHSLPEHEESDVFQPYKTPAMLQKAGVEFCLAHNQDMISTTRNLAFFAGTASAYGLTKEQALMSITSSTAKILGIADRTGTLKVGMDANLVISEGDILDMRTNKLTHAFIQGRNVNLEAKQQRLSKKYSEKLGQK
ncbi:MAG: imidazolonepropionase-like amidohydrolase [Arenicella sp.]|jgi:imidazolonepropionase-like amidohydrolase